MSDNVETGGIVAAAMALGGVLVKLIGPAAGVVKAWLGRTPPHEGDVRYTDADELFAEARRLRDELRAELNECREARAEYAKRLDKLSEECRDDRRRSERSIAKLEFEVARLRGMLTPDPEPEP